MAPSSSDDGDILTCLHAGPLDNPLWNRFLAALRHRLGADFCGFFFRQGDAHITDSTEISVGPAGQEDLLPAYTAGFHTLDPIPYDQLVPGQVYSLAQFIVAGDPGHERYLREFLIPGRRQFMRVLRVSAPEGYNAWLMAWRADRDFTPGDDAVLAALAPHLAISLELYSVIERERVRAGISGDAVRQLNYGWLTLDGRGFVLDMDQGAADLLRGSAALRVQTGSRMLAASADVNRQLTAALEEFSADPEARPRAVRLSEDPWLDMLLRPVRDHVLSGPARPVLTAFVHGDRETGANRVDQYVRLFGLSPSEARLALAILRGRTIAEAATELGVTEQTARGYSKIVYAKTGARGQADLVRILLASAARLA